MIFAGLDEAALGPKLGPFCVCLTRFQYENTDEDSSNLSTLLAPAISREKKDRTRITVGDSKAVYTAGRSGSGLAVLEEAVLAFLSVAGLDLPDNFSDLIKLLTEKSDLEEMLQTPWFAEAADLKLPVSTAFFGPEASTRIKQLQETLLSSGITVLQPEMRFVPARRFNQELRAAGGKGGAVQNLISPLIVRCLGNNEDTVSFSVDRQGGRRYYGEWLLSLFPGSSLGATEETPQRSAYSVGPHSLEFLVKADAIRTETALASMFAKYVRELAMLLFNRWWNEKVSGIRPTAGYPEDARRFIAELKSLKALPKDQESLIRQL